MPAHKNLTGVDLHEPKGVASATSGSVYVADGVGSGVWQILSIPEGTFTIQQSLFTSSGTWNKPANLMFVRVYLQGGGESSTGTNGGTTSFGSYVTATGGGASLQSDGDINSAYISSTTFRPISGYAVPGLLSPLLPWSKYNGGAVADSSTVGLAGNWATKVIAANSLTSSVAVTIGAGGSGGTIADSGHVFIESYIQV